MRADGRQPDELRPVEITPGFIETAHGSALIEAGRTRVICTAMVEEAVPPWLRGRGRGWVTGEYGMLPGSTGERRAREASRGRVDGRTQEIQRLIGRSLRAVADLEALGERTVWVDCDVIQADGGTRCASICGGYVALEIALRGLVDRRLVKELPLTDSIAAVSVGIVDGRPLLDLSYVEDSVAEVDMNVVMTGAGRLVEVQATAEGQTFARDELTVMLDLAARGIESLRGAQVQASLAARAGAVR
ncbi:MAG TPA: ribonuclease PH [Miltoncostaeaceae bacterium]|nr:ribonuclease PH [Miltoncostaeaceae bacterium]